MEDQIGTIGILGFLATLVAEQLFGSWLHKRFMAAAALLTGIGITYAVWFVGDAADFGISFQAVQDLPLTAVWAYGLVVFIAAHYERRALKSVAPGLADPSVKVGDLVGLLVKNDKAPPVTSVVTDMNVLAGDTVLSGDNLMDKENPNTIATVIPGGAGTDNLVVVINGAIHTLPRSRFRWLNAPRR